MSTIHKNTSFTLNGVNKVNVGGDIYSWDSNKWLMGVDVWSGDKNKTYTTTITLDGNGWNMSFVRVTGEANMKVKITDSATNSSIEHLLLGNAGSDVTLNRTQVNYIDAYDNGADNITLGIAGADAISLRDGNDILRTGTGFVGSVRMDNGNDRVTIGTGNAEIVAMGNGNDTVTLKGDVDSLSLGNGNNTVNGSGDVWVSAIHGGNGRDIVTFSGNCGAGAVYLGDGRNTLTGGTRFIDTIFGLNGDDTVTLNGGARSINLAEGSNIIATGAGFVSSIAVDDDDDTITIGTGGAGSIFSWGAGGDTILIKGWVGSITTGGGNDRVTMNAGGEALAVTLRGGDDYLKVSDIANPDDGAMFNGGTGTDTIDFSTFTTDVNVSLSGGGVSASGREIFARGFENVVGGAGNDDLYGTAGGNIIDGGAGSDTLISNGGADTLVFADDYGSDIISDFSIAGNAVIDLSELTAITDFADLVANHMTQSGAHTQITNGNGDTLQLSNVTAANLTASDFIF